MSISLNKIEEVSSRLADREPVSGDQEVWLKDRLYTLVRLVRGIQRQKAVAADDPLIDCAIDGAVNGAAIEVIRTLGLTPSYTNLRREPSQGMGEASVFPGGEALINSINKPEARVP